MTLTAIKTEATDYPSTWAAQGLNLPGRDLGWLQKQRNAAAQVFAEQGFPRKGEGAGMEDWKYSHSKLRPIESALLPLAEAGAAVELPDACCDGIRIVMVDGYLDAQRSDLQSLPSGLSVKPIAEVLNSHECRFAAIASQTDRPLGALNLAWFTGGLAINVSRSSVIRKPLVIEHILTAEHVALPRVLVRIEPQSELTLIERYSSKPSTVAWVNAVTEIDLEPTARLSHTVVQELDIAATLTADIAVRQAKDSFYRSDRFELGARLARTDLRTRQIEIGAEAELNGLYMPVGEQHHDMHTWVEHEAPHGISRELYKGVLNDRARAVFNGMVRVYKDAQKVDSEQSNNNLLLSRDAEIDTKPELEIYADDVKCAHGATVGALDKTAMFYLRSRGLDEEAAEAMLTWAFAAEMVERLENETLQAYLTKLIAERMQAEDFG